MLMLGLFSPYKSLFYSTTSTDVRVCQLKMHEVYKSLLGAPSTSRNFFFTPILFTQKLLIMNSRAKSQESSLLFACLMAWNGNEVTPPSTRRDRLCRRSLIAICLANNIICCTHCCEIYCTDGGPSQN